MRHYEIGTKAIRYGRVKILGALSDEVVAILVLSYFLTLPPSFWLNKGFSPFALETALVSCQHFVGVGPFEGTRDFST